MTARVALITDSTCDLSPELAAERHIYVAPLYVIWGEEALRDGIDLGVVEFYRRLVSTGEIPKTAQASPQDFVTLFEKARQAEQADEVVCAVLSSDLSGTYASAMQAKENVNFPVHVIDTRQVTLALGHCLLAGADARDSGASAQEIVRVIQESARRQWIVFTIESLEYIHRGGRIGNARLLLGSALNVKPVLELREGVIAPVGNVRTRKRAIEQLLKTAEKEAAGRPIERLSVIHGDVEEEGQALLNEAIKRFSPAETHFSYICMPLGVHVGPGALGLIVNWSENSPTRAE